jgi:YD repeat-containing protein
VYTSSATPTFTTVATDPDANSYRVTFEVLTSTSATTPVASCTSGYVASGATASCAPGTALSDNTQYVVRAKVQDDQGLWNGTWSPWRTIRVATGTPAAPTITCQGYGHDTWHEDVPGAPVSCTASASGSGFSAPASMTLVVDGVTQTIAATTAGSVSTAFTIANTAGTHVVTASVASAAGKGSTTAQFLVGFGAASLTAPTAGLSSTGVVRVAGALPKPGTTGYTARVQWRLAGQSGAETAWTTAGANLTQTAKTSTVDVTGLFDTQLISGEGVSSRAPVTVQLRACLVPTGGSSCTLGATLPTTMVRLPSAFGSGYPVDDTAGVGSVALFTGELAVSDTDVTFAGQSVSRRHATFAGDGTTEVGPGIFGPGWYGELGAVSGLAEAQIIDRTKDDGTIVLDDGSGDPLIYGHPSGLRGTYSLTGAPASGLVYEPVTEITEESETILRLKAVSGSHRLELVEPDGTITSFAPTSALPSGTVPVSSEAVVWRSDTVTDPSEAAGSSSAKTYFYPVAAGDAKIGRIVTVPVGKTSTECPNTPTPPASARGCQYLHLSYGTATTGTASTPGDAAGQVKSISVSMWDPAAAGGAGAMDTVPMAGYGYDNLKRLVTVSDSRTGLLTRYGWDGTSSRLATVTDPGLAPYRIFYDAATAPGTPAAPRVARVTRDNPTSASTYDTLVAATPPAGSQVLAAYRYDLTPTQVAGLNLSDDAAGVGAWYQKSAPVKGFAVFTGDAPAGVTAGTSTSPAGVSGSDWRFASLSYTDAQGYTVNTASYGAGRWLPTSTDYDPEGRITRTLDAAAITAILDTPAVESEVEVAAMSTENVYTADGLLTEVYGPARDVVVDWNGYQAIRTHTVTVYDGGAPNGGVNPATGGKYNLPTRVDVSAATTAKTDIFLMSRTYTEYGPVSTDGVSDGYDGWGTGNATRVIVRDNYGDAAKDIVRETRYDSRHRVIETRQPLSAGKTDAGSTLTRYYTTGAHPDDSACGNRPEWEGMVCKTLPGAAPTLNGTVTGAPTPTVTYTYDKWGNTATETDTVNTTSRISTTGYDAAGRQVSTVLSVANLAGASTATARPGTTTVYSPSTGAVLETRLTSTPSEKESTGYDGWGRLVTATNQDGQTSTTTYDSAGRVASTTNITGTTTYTYGGVDADGNAEHRGLPTTATVDRDGGGGALAYAAAYDAAGNLVTHALPGKVTARSTFNATGDLATLTYTGQVTPVTETVDPDTGETTWTPGAPVQDQPWLGWTRRIDALSRVKDEYTSHGTSFDGVPGVTDPGDITAPDTGDAIASTKAYGYDYAGNLAWVMDRTATATGVHAGVLDGAADPVFPCTQRDYTFDKNGNRTSDKSKYAATGECFWGSTTSSNSYSYDTGDRAIASGVRPGIAAKNYSYDTLGRVTLLPAADAPTPEHGDITLGYYDDDLPRAITQGQTATTFTLDVLARRHVTTSTTGTGSAAVTTTVRNHYDDTSDNPAWTTTQSSTGGGAPGPVQTLRFTGGIDADLTAIITGTGEATLNLNNPGGHLAATVSIPADQNTATAAAGIDSWNDYTEYGAPKHTTTPAGSSATTSAGGYGWYAQKQRHTSPATAELTLMGVRLYNRVRGLFTATDPIPGGNTNTYTHPTDPINQHDLDGKWRKWWKSNQHRVLGGIKLALGVAALFGCAACGLASMAWAAYDVYKARNNRRAAAGAAIGFIPVVGRAGAAVRASVQARKAANLHRLIRKNRKSPQKASWRAQRRQAQQRAASARQWGNRYGRKLDAAIVTYDVYRYGRNW